MTDEELTKLNEDAKRVADHCAQEFRHGYQIDMDYSPESLKKVDDLIDQLLVLPEAKQILTTEFGLLVGSYVGEIIRRRFGGRWINTTLGERPVTALAWVGKDKNVILYPMVKVEKRANNGREDSLYFYYQAAEDMLNRSNLAESLEEQAQDSLKRIDDSQTNNSKKQP